MPLTIGLAAERLGVASVRMRRPLGPLHRLSVTCLGAALIGSLTACGSLLQSPPAPTPADFQGIAGDVVQRGIRIDHIVSGDAGCADGELQKTAIAFDAVGLDQATPVRIHLYIFRNRESYEKLRATVDACARTYVRDPDAFESVETSPYVVAGQGPWGQSFKTNLRAAIEHAAGTGS